MTNEELAEFLGIAGPAFDKAKVADFIAELDPAKREAYERMARVEIELRAYQAGLGPKPSGVIICHDHHNEQE